MNEEVGRGAIERLADAVIEKVSGPSWQPLKQTFLDMSNTLLSAGPNTVGVLTTIYVKYQLTGDPNSGVFAVAWLKTSKQIVLGLALPANVDSPILGPAPPRTTYKGITKYLIIKPGDSLPKELCDWAKSAFELVASTTNS